MKTDEPKTKVLEPVTEYTTVAYLRCWPTIEDMEKFAIKIDPVETPAEIHAMIEANFWSLF